jgi:hypothetical protein
MLAAPIVIALLIIEMMKMRFIPAVGKSKSGLNESKQGMGSTTFHFLAVLGLVG